MHQYLTLLRRGLIPASALTSPLKALPQWIIDFLISKASFAVIGAAAGLSLFIEEKRRRGELAMYVLPKGLESAWVMARGKGWVFRTGKWGETLLTAIGMAMVMVGAFVFKKGYADPRLRRQHIKTTHSIFLVCSDEYCINSLVRIKWASATRGFTF